MAQTLSDIKQLLADHGLRPKKKFGQNFLHDGNHMAKIMDAAQLAPGDTVLEVGPGTGALTERLVEAGANVVAVEIDRDMEPILQARLGEKITLHIGDALDGKHAINAEVLKLLGDKSYKLIANLPYNIASPLMANLAIDHLNMTGMVVMIQKEVADRLLSPPGTKAYGPLGVLIQALFEVQRVGVLKPGCFYPPPSIDSAVVAMHRRAQPLCEDAKALGELLHKLFSKRRKQLGSILGRDVQLPEGVEITMRPEQLSVEQLCELTRKS
jgi:16S rRNA (adenine1518-N6/adenine1519-N6)-dimethyltransferase